jgi:hypothetical protein
MSRSQGIQAGYIFEQVINSSWTAQHVCLGVRGLLDSDPVKSIADRREGAERCQTRWPWRGRTSPPEYGGDELMRKQGGEDEKERTRIRKDASPA